MNKLRLLLAAAVAVALTLGLIFEAQAKLPPLSAEAKAKAEEAKAKTAWSDKVASYKLCQSMERTAVHYFKTSGKDPKAATSTAPCADPGPFVYTPPEAAPAAPATPPLEAAGAHSPAKTAAAPPSSKATDAEQKGAAKK